MRVEARVRPETANQGAEAVLFVEGEAPEALDPTVLAELFRDLQPPLRVQPLRSCLHVQAAAQALHPYHPNYYFLIDRDARDDGEVERSWRDFPDPATFNLLIWRRHELENYFLEPTYLRRSCFLKQGVDLAERVLKEANGRLFLDALRAVLDRLRRQLRAKWLDLPKDPSTCRSRQAAHEHLDELRERFSSKMRSDAQYFRLDRLHDKVDAQIDQMTGGGDTLAHEQGDWLLAIGGKQVFRAVVSACFDVHDTAGKSLTGRDAERALCRELLQHDLADQPDDFQKLHALMSRIKP